MKEMKRGLKLKMKRNKKLLYFLGGLAFIGVVAGSIFLTFIENNDQIMVRDYITSFTESIRDGKLVYLDTFKNTICSNFGYATIIFVLAISVIGIPIILFLYFAKSFMIGFSISSFVFTYGFKGTIFSAFYIIPHFLNFIFYTILLIYAIKISYLLIECLFSKKEVNLKKAMSKYITYFILLLILLTFTSMIECFLVPMILKKLLFLL
jgi:stage II sporulation protein M